MRANILPIAVLLLAFAYLTLTSPTVGKRTADAASEEKTTNNKEENIQPSENETLPLKCELYIEENGKIVPTNLTKEELAQENIQYHEICEREEDKAPMMGPGTIASLCCG